MFADNLEPLEMLRLENQQLSQDIRELRAELERLKGADVTFDTKGRRIVVGILAAKAPRTADVATAVNALAVQAYQALDEVERLRAQLSQAQSGRQQEEDMRRHYERAFNEAVDELTETTEELNRAHSAQRILANLDAAGRQFEDWPGERGEDAI